jgi:uncharacterized cupredoxin-like copper-binding protein
MEEHAMKSRRAWIWGLAVACALAVALSFGIGASSGVAQEGTPSSEAAAACPAATPGAGAEATPAAEQCVTIESYDIYFEPNLVTIPANTPVTIVLPNEGAALHNFSITDHGNPDMENLDISVDLPPGETRSVTVEAEPGTYYFYCNVPGHEAAGMFGYLVVEEGAEISAETTDVTPPAG